MRRSLIVALGMAGCLAGGPPNGRATCGADPGHECVNGYYCAPETDTCWKLGQAPVVPADYRIAPNPALVAIDGTAQLQMVSGDAVTWSIDEADGGAIDSDGRYRAPAVRGSYHVTARRTSDGLKAHGVVHVAPAGLNLIAGAIGGQGGADDVGDDARLYPRVLALHPVTRQLYLGDFSCVRTISATGAVSTIAGRCSDTGTASGDPADARFDNILGLAVHPSGDLYVADDTDRIRKITPDGEVSVVAGGAAGSLDGSFAMAQFKSPRRLVWNDAGTILYVADSGNNVVRKLDFSVVGGLVSTLATVFTSPQSLALDEVGSLLYVGENTGAVKKVDLTGGGATVLTNVARPLGLALDLIHARVWVAGADTTIIRAISTSTGQVLTTLGTDDSHRHLDGPSPLFDGPSSLALDGDLLYVGEIDNTDVRKVTLAPALDATTLAGRPPHRGVVEGAAADARFDTPIGVAAAADGTVYIADSANHRVRMLSFPDGAVSTLAGSSTPGSADGDGVLAQLDDPEAIALDPSGAFLFVADTGNHAIRRVALDATHHVETWWTASATAVLSSVAVDSTSMVWVLDRSAKAMIAITPAKDVAHMRLFANVPYAIAVDAEDNLVFADDATVYRFRGDATPSVLAGPGFDQVRALAIDDRNRIYVSERTASRLVRLLPPTTDELTWRSEVIAGVPYQAGVRLGASPRLNAVAGLALSPVGTLLLTDRLEHCLLELFP